MDDFRRIQKSLCTDGSSRKHKYGCPCCWRWNVSLNTFKKLTRKAAKAKLNARVSKFIKEECYV